MCCAPSPGRRAGRRARGEPHGRAAGADRRRGLQRAAQARCGGPDPAGAADPGRPGAARPRAARGPGRGVPALRRERARGPRRAGQPGQAGSGQAAAGAPEAKPELDQTHCTVDTKIRRVLRMHEAGALAGRRILILGDDDLVSVAIAARGAAVLGGEGHRPAGRDRLRPRGAGLGRGADRRHGGGGGADRARPAPPAARRPGVRVRRGLHRPALHRGRAGHCSCPARWPGSRPSRAGTCSSRSVRAGRRRPCAPRS